MKKKLILPLLILIQTVIFSSCNTIEVEVKDLSTSSSSSSSSSSNNPNFVDPSLILDDDGNLIMFYLPGVIGENPAGCSEYPCSKEIRSASADLESDNLYVVDGARVEQELDGSEIRTFSDPDIIKKSDGSYLLYISEGQSVRAYSSSSLSDEFTEEGFVSENEGGVPSGITIDEDEYWLYVVRGSDIWRATSSDGLEFGTFSTISINDTESDYKYADPSIIKWPWEDEDNCEGLTDQKYLLAYHYCDESISDDCNTPTNHKVAIASGDDGENWSPIYQFETFKGSVPDIIFKDGYLYLFFTAGESSNWKKYNSCFEVIDEGETFVDKW